MAARDEALFVAGTAAAPLDYTAPGAVIFRLKSVYAEYDGTGAAGDFLPAVKFVSDSGHVNVVAADQGVKITAGNTAAVSWFPGVKPAPRATSGGGVAFARGNYDSAGNPPFGVGAGLNDSQPFYQLTNTDPTVFTWSTTTNHNDTLTLHPAGTYICFCGYQGGTGGNVGGPIIVPSNGPELIHNYQFFSASPGVPGGFANAGDYTVIHSTATDYTVQVIITNPSGFNMSVFTVDFYVCYLATGA